ncbi:hypothetical protein MMC13_001532 [Lambiella insularis]|nr:hypothetical protein [Lambiella insularis]
MQPPPRRSLLILLTSLISITVSHPSPSSSLPSSVLTLDSLTPSSPAPLSRRATSRALTDCREGAGNHDHAYWSFQESFCVQHNHGHPDAFRAYHITCRAPAQRSNLQGPVNWRYETISDGVCGPREICVDGPYTPPNAALAQLHWYKRYGTAHCVELQHMATLAQQGVNVLNAGQEGAELHRRVETSRALTDCCGGYGEHHADWVFQQSWCERRTAFPYADYVGTPRNYRITCRAPGLPSMLQGPVYWAQQETTDGECTPTQICVDGPYTPPNPAMMHMPWYKRRGTAYCVELQHLIDMAQSGLDVLHAEQAGGGAAVPAPPAPAPAALQRRTDNVRPITDCSIGRDEHGLGGNHANWVFQQSWCEEHSSYLEARYYRKFRIVCRAPGVPSMLEGPVPWYQTAFAISECTPSQICVDGPYTPPNPAMMQMPWYKTHGTAYCVEHQHFVHLSLDAMHVLAIAEGGDGTGGAGGAAGAAVPAPILLQRRFEGFRALTDCSEGRNEHSIGGNHADWVFQHSRCAPRGQPRNSRQFRILCHAPGAFFMLEVPKSWTASTALECTLGQICVDGPQTPPDAELRELHWYRQHDTAYCVELQYLQGLSRAARIILLAAAHEGNGITEPAGAAGMARVARPTGPAGPRWDPQGPWRLEEVSERAGLTGPSGPTGPEWDLHGPSLSAEGTGQAEFRRPSGPPGPEWSLQGPSQPAGGTRQAEFRRPSGPESGLRGPSRPAGVIGQAEFREPFGPSQPAGGTGEAEFRGPSGPLRPESGLQGPSQPAGSAGQVEFRRPSGPAGYLGQAELRGPAGPAGPAAGFPGFGGFSGRA